MKHKSCFAAFRTSGIVAVTLLLAANAPAVAKDTPDGGQGNPAQFEVTRNSVGPITLGATIGDVRIAAPDLRFVRGAGPENTIIVEVIKDDVLVMTLWTEEDIGYDEDGNAPPIDDSAVIVGIDILDPRYRTHNGVGVGIAAEEAEQAMGKLKSMYNDPHGGEVPTFYGQPDYLYFSMGMPDGSQAYTAGVYAEVPDCQESYPPLCQIARRFNAGAKIVGMGIGSGAPIPKQVIEITGHPSGITVMRESPSGEKCSGDLPITTYTLWLSALGADWFQAIEVEGVSDCVEDDVPFERVDHADQSFVHLGDFNFDGATDIALHNGNYGGYGSMSYDVFFFDAASGKFELDERFSDLTQSLGMFEVDAANRMLFVHSKSGAAWHQRSGYVVVAGEPRKVYEKTGEYTGEDTKIETTRFMIDGEWKTLVERVAVEQDTDAQ